MLKYSWMLVGDIARKCLFSPTQSMLKSPEPKDTALVPRPRRTATSQKESLSLELAKPNGYFWERCSIDLKDRWALMIVAARRTLWSRSVTGNNAVCGHFWCALRSLVVCTVFSFVFTGFDGAMSPWMSTQHVDVKRVSAVRWRYAAISTSPSPAFSLLLSSSRVASGPSSANVRSIAMGFSIPLDPKTHILSMVSEMTTLNKSYRGWLVHPLV